MARQANQHLAPVGACVFTAHRAALDHPINQLHGAVVQNLKPVGELPDRRPGAFGQSFDGKQQLVLLRLESMAAGRHSAELQKPANLKTKLRQSAIFL
jgi:hypothetical protein